MNRWYGLLNLLQALAYLALGLYLQARWLPAGVMLYVAAAAQLGGGGLLLAGRGVRMARWASMLGLVVSALLLGLHIQVGVHIVQTFTPIGGEKGWLLMSSTLLAVPSVAFIPLWQLITTRPSRLQGGGTAAAMLLSVALPGLHAWSQDADQSWPAQDTESAALWLYESWKGEDPGPAPVGDDVLLAVSVVQDGEVLETLSASGPLDQALAQALPQETPWNPDAGLTLDIVLESTPIYLPPLGPPGVALLRPGNTVLMSQDRVRSSATIWRKPATRRALDTLSVTGHSLRSADHTATTDAWVVSEAGAAPLFAGWTAPEPTTPDALRAAAVAGAHWMDFNMKEDGRFAYKVMGPSGNYGRGYNYPRHAGSSWFLARVATRTGDERAHRAALRAIAHAKSVTQWTDDGRAYVHDPSRKDGKAWVGTTALQLLALTELGVEPELAEAYAAFVASAVDERGSVRGDMDVATGTWPEQDEVTYAQGQGLLALAAAERAGIDVSDALDRAIAYVEGDYWPAPAARFGMLDEHWMCIATAAVDEVRGVAAGLEACTAYLANVRTQAPVRGGGLNPPAGPAAGLAEAVVARAEVDRRRGIAGPYQDRALAYADQLLAQQYRPTDAPFLGIAPRLMGAFRDRPWALNVQVDGVQHIGCALLGAEQLLSGQELPGAMP